MKKIVEAMASESKPLGFEYGHFYTTRLDRHCSSLVGYSFGTKNLRLAAQKLRTKNLRTGVSSSPESRQKSLLPHESPSVVIERVAVDPAKHDQSFGGAVVNQPQVFTRWRVVYR